jgi:replication factor C large subunit
MSPSPRPDHRPLADRARPERLDEIVGNAPARDALRDWAEAWAQASTPPAHRAAILEGPPGVGKTTAALAVAREHGWTVVEMNASDARNESALDLVAGRASLSHSLGDSGVYETGPGHSRSLILLDEADCLTGRATEDAAPRPARVTLREFLRTRYVTVDALGGAWGLGTPGNPPGFSKWDDVPLTAGRAAWTRLGPAQRDISDWRGAEKPPDISDRGGMGAIARLVRETRQPLLLTVNDVEPLTRYSPVFRSGVARIRFYPVRDAELKQLLRRTAVRERIGLAPEALEAIIRRSHGDVRGALNDLDAIAPLPPGPAQVSVLGGRDQLGDMYRLVEEVYGHPRFFRSVQIRDWVDATPDDVLPWVEENLPRATEDPRRRHAGYELLGRAELQLARARRQRVWALWSFASEVMTGGVGLAADGGGRSFPVAFPQFLGAMGRSRFTRALRQSTLGKAGRHWHFSRRKGVEVGWPFLAALFDSPPGKPPSVALLRRAVVRELGVSADELAFLMRVEASSRSVTELLAVPAAPSGDENESKTESAPTRPSTPAAPKKASRPYKKAAQAAPPPDPKPPPPPKSKRVQRRLPDA